MQGVAEKCFIENRNLFGNAQTQPEKFNLYQGLANLANTVDMMQDQINKLNREILALRQQLNR